MPFALTGWSHLTNYQVACSEIMPTELGLRHVHILVADPVVCGSQKAYAFAHDLQDTSAQFDAFLLRLRLADHHGKCLFLQAAGVGNIQGLCHAAQFGKRFVLKFKYFHVLFPLDCGMLECKSNQQSPLGWLESPLVCE